ncbi:YIP1 family protein [Hymenobacter sp. HDW8]|uniref:YIP1 family protein n=1 Tax=Hymenobacter sp. HDW8 TaxID=2714932 RepID=UPI001409B732|nr:YIP1 family protein [Hymenobacter sp. HDW8]QIL77013.1 hypothetical protein G7064_14985 [Hymenobacter sp. HDW8]
MPTTTILLTAIIMGGLTGWIVYYFYAWLMSVTGKWLKGQAASDTFRTILAWAMVPSIFTLLLIIPEVLIFGDDLFKSEHTNTSSFNSIMWVFFALTEAVLSSWTLVILVKGICLIQGFNTGKAIINMLLPGVLIVVPLLLLGLLLQTV